MKVVIDKVARLGMHSGSATLRKIWNTLAPSIRAASRKSLGIVRICCTSINTAKGRKMDGMMTLA